MIYLDTNPKIFDGLVFAFCQKLENLTTGLTLENGNTICMYTDKHGTIFYVPVNDFERKRFLENGAEYSDFIEMLNKRKNADVYQKELL